MKCLFYKLAVAGLCVSLISACQDESIADSSRLEYDRAVVESSSFQDEVPELSLTSEASLPAYISQAEHSLSKQDRFDTRINFRNLYGTTDPPNGQTRALAEFEATEGVLISWDNQDAEYLFSLIQLSASRAKVWILTRSLSESKQLESLLVRNGVDPSRLEFFEYRHESVWTRDYGPWTIVDEQAQAALVDFKYYPERRRDDAIPTLMSNHFTMPVYRPNLEIEGGNFMSDGAGRCFFSSRVLEVNYAKDNQDLADLFYEYLGCTQALVLEPLIGEGTAHIDMFAKLTGPNTMLLGEYSDQIDPMNRAILDRNYQRIQDFARKTDWSLEIIRIPMPAPRSSGAYPSYTNSLIVNDLVIVPIYPSQPQFEAEALRAYQQAFSDQYDIAVIDADNIIEMGGAVHCTTMGFIQAGQLVAPAGSAIPTDFPEAPINPTLNASNNLQVFSSTQSQRIPDDGEIYDQITVMIDNIESLREQFQVKLNLNHSYPSDLKISLWHKGREMILFNRETSNSTQIAKTFTVSRSSSYDPNGDWTLMIEDLEAQDEGVLESWSLSF